MGTTRSSFLVLAQQSDVRLSLCPLGRRCPESVGLVASLPFIRGGLNLAAKRPRSLPPSLRDCDCLPVSDIGIHARPRSRESVENAVMKSPSQSTSTEIHYLLWGQLLNVQGGEHFAFCLSADTVDLEMEEWRRNPL